MKVKDLINKLSQSKSGLKKPEQEEPKLPEDDLHPALEPEVIAPLKKKSDLRFPMSLRLSYSARKNKRMKNMTLKSTVLLSMHTFPNGTSSLSSIGWKREDRSSLSR